MESPCIYEQKLRKAFREFWALVGIGLFASGALILLFKPESQSLGSWFQRGGSILSIFGLLAQMRAIEIYNILNPSLLVEESFAETHERYRKCPAFYNAFSLGLTVAGTIIWGYGDLCV